MRPLDGIIVVSLEQAIAAPFCTRQLAELGARVIKIERPGSGDESRGWGPPFDSRGESAYYVCCNRNKFSVAADCDKAEDAEFIRSLIATADVAVDNLDRKSVV